MIPREVMRHLRQVWSGCWEWQRGVNNHGYGTLRYKGKMELAHRVVMGLPRGEVRHTCDNPKCCNPDHLLVGSHASNMRDMVLRGRQARGEGNGRSTLTEDTVRAVRDSPGSQKERAVRFGMSQQNVSDICTRKTWRHVL